MGMRKLSVCIPTHRDDLKLYNAISSVLDQEYPRDLIDLCIFTNGLSPSTKEHFRANRLTQSSVAMGPSSAKNSALSMAETEYAILLDSDDMLIPSALKIYNKVLDSYPDLRVGCEFSAVNLIRRPEGFGAHFHRTEEEFGSFFFNNISRVHETGAVGRPIIFKTEGRPPFDSDYSFSEERKLAIDLWEDKTPVHIMKTCTYVYNWNEQGITGAVAVADSPKFTEVTQRLGAMASKVEPNVVVTEPLYLVPPPERTELARWAMLEKMFDRRNQ